MEFRGYDKSFSLKGKTALITGAGGGIGRAIATLFYEKGANLILLDLNPNIQSVGQEIAPDPERLLTAAADITLAAQTEEPIIAGLAKFGTIDILVNNAGVALLEPALEVPEANWDKTMDLNLKAPFFPVSTGWLGDDQAWRRQDCKPRFPGWGNCLGSACGLLRQ